MNLPRYNESRPCAKCGSPNASTRFVPEMTLPVSRDPDDMRTRKVDARMERRCPRCGHSWTEAPLDALSATIGNIIGNAASPTETNDG